MKIERRFFVVIHALSNYTYAPKAWEHVEKSAELAYANGADGVFLIPDYQKGEAAAMMDDLFHFYTSLRSRYEGRDFKIGVNFLSRKIERYFLQREKFQMLQMDCLTASKLDLPETEIFAGLAFKYSESVNVTGAELREICEKIAPHAHVPTTSGTKTGIPPTSEKIKEIKSYIPKNSRLGVASGVDEKNVKALITAGATDFLVATSLIKEVEDKMDILDGQKISALAKAIKI